jgi:Uma2 family endonuclease
MSAIAPPNDASLKNDPFAGERIVAQKMSYETFLQAYEGLHAEWYDGKVILMANNIQHQLIVGFLQLILALYLGSLKLGRVITAPYSTRMDDANQMPHREPDLMVVLTEHLGRLTPTWLEGPADIAIEVVSEESVGRDYATKFQEYEKAGVREYWIIDPIRRSVSIHVLDSQGLYYLLNSPHQITSTVLPDFALDSHLLWQPELPSALDEIINIVQPMIKSREDSSHV